MTPCRLSFILVSALCGTVAQADVTAQQVWDNFSDQMAIYGDGFTTGAEVASPYKLTIEDVVINLSDTEAAVTSVIGDIVFTENGDGTVTMAVPDSYPVKINLTPQAGNPSVITLTVSSDNMALIASGDPDAIDYTVRADRYAWTIDSIEGADMDGVDLEQATIAILDLFGTYSSDTTDLIRVTYGLEIGAIDIDFVASEPDDDDVVVSLTADVANIELFANAALPIDMDLSGDQPPFQDGLAFDGGYSFNDLSYFVEARENGIEMGGSALINSGTLAVALDQDGVTYTSDTRGFSADMSAAFGPVGLVEISAASYGIDVQIPFSRSDDNSPRDVVMGFNLTDLALGNDIWDVFDPTGILNRDPATVALGLQAKVTPYFDLLDPTQREALMLSDVPGEINNLEITNLTLRAAGAEITGDGSFTFDNSDLETFPGVPRPLGEANFAINGINQLIDNLIQMGLIPQDQAMMPRMMMGMVTTPVGDDELRSNIEINNEGHIFANGQRLR